MILKNNVIFILTVIIINIAPIATAADVAMEKQIDIFLKAMKHNRTILKSADEKIRVGIIYNSRNKKSATLMINADDAFYEQVKAKRKIENKPILYSIVDCSSAQKLETDIKQLNITALFVLAGNDEHLAAITKIANEKKIITFAGDSSYLAHGIATGVEEINGKIKFVVNLAIAKEQNADFKASLLKLSKVIK